MEGGKYFEEFCQIASENSDNLFSYTYEFRINLYPGLNENIEQAERTTASDEEAVLMENPNNQTESKERIIYLKLLHLTILLRRKNFLRFLLTKVDSKTFTDKISISPTEFVSCGKDSWIFGANYIHFAARFDPVGLHLILSYVDDKIDLINRSVTERKWSPLHVAVCGDDSISTRLMLFYVFILL